MKRLPLASSQSWVPMAATLVFASLLATLLGLGVKRAAQLQSASSALQAASALQAQPQLLTAELTLLQRSLENTSFIGDGLARIQRGEAQSDSAMAAISATIDAAGLRGDASLGEALAGVESQWRKQRTALGMLRNVDASGIYVDGADGSQLSSSGRDLRNRVNELLDFQSHNSGPLTAAFNALASRLQGAVADMGSQLRLLLLAGTALASLLIALMLYFAMRAHTSGRAAQQAAQQVSSILASVREGLFLLDREGCVGVAHSASLIDLLHNPRPGGHLLTDLLQPMVDEKTQLAAGRYLNLLWNERVNEELIESVNPLQQVAVNLARPEGGTETRYLSFSFHRASESHQHLMASVTDITDNVLLQQEIEQLKASADAGSSLMSQLLQADAAQLGAFLGNAERSLASCNATLTEPGREKHSLKDKIDAVFRELHTTKGEAAALGLQGYARRTHATEDILSALRQKSDLTGSDFVPVVTHLDELLRYTAELSSARSQLASYAGSAGARPPAADAPASLPGAAATDRAGEDQLTPLLRSLAATVGRACGREVQLHCSGLGEVPAEHAERVKNICVQMVRNCIAHGIEAPEARGAAGKPPGGSISVSFNGGTAGECLLVVEDDGQGLNYDRILYRARQLQLVRPDQTTGLDRGSVFKMIFMPGFSTASEVGEHAGRGIGLDAVNNIVRECGGRIGIATVAGQFTRFRITLPRAAGALAQSA